MKVLKVKGVSSTYYYRNTTSRKDTVVMKKIRIIIADDFDIIREDLSYIINKQSDMMVVAQANSGKSVVEEAEKLDYDIVLMDIEMEHPTAGIEATRKIRDENKHAQIIFLTAHASDDIILQAMATGAIDYIVKGMPEDEILEHIRSASKGKSLMERDVKQIIMKEFSRLRETEESLVLFINNLSKLTGAEREIVRLLLQNKKIREIAEERNVEVVTVKTQISGLLRKFEERRTKAIVKKIKELQLTHLFEQVEESDAKADE